jgi:threonine-phosphate decarboxylase
MDCRPADIIDMSSNMNPLGPPPGLLEFLKEHLDVITRLPEVDSCRAITAFAATMQIDPTGLLAGNGTTQFIYSIPAVLESERALILAPTYSDYADACKLHHVACHTLVTEESMDFQPDLDSVAGHLSGVDTVFLCNPNNPTGRLIPGQELQQLCRSHPEVRFIVDESYLPFVSQHERHSLVNARLANVVVLASVSKIFRIPGLRVGFVIGTPAMMDRFRRHLPPWSMNSLAQVTVEFVATHGRATESFVNKSQQYFELRRAQFADLLKTVPQIRLVSGRTPFVLMKLPEALSADAIQNRLDSQRILVRNCANFSGLSERFIRVSLKSARINRMLANLLIAAACADTGRQQPATPKRWRDNP